MDVYDYKGIKEGKYAQGEIEAINKDEAAYKAANIPPEDLRKDVKVIMPPLDLFGKS